jgi:hypothetical protein
LRQQAVVAVQKPGVETLGTIVIGTAAAILFLEILVLDDVLF